MEVERHIGSSSLHDSHRIEKHQLAAIYHHTYCHFGLYLVLLLQQYGQTVGDAVNLAISETLVLEYDTRIVGRLNGLLCKQIY